MMFKQPAVLTIALLIIFLCPASASADFIVDQYAYYQEVTVSHPDTYYIELNASVLNACREDLADIRLTSPQGEEIPYYMEYYLCPDEISLPANILDNSSPDSGHRQIYLDSGNDHFNHNRLVLQLTGDDDFECDVLIAGSYDREQYESLSMNRIYGQPGEVTSNELTYPIKNYRYLRLDITGENASGISIESAEYRYRPPESQSLALLSAMQINSYYDPASNASNYVIDLGVKNLTVHDVLILSQFHDFTRLVNVFGGNDGENWRLLTRDARIYDYRWPDYSSRIDSIAVNQNAGRYLKIEIMNGDKKELNVEGINVLGMVPRMVAALNPGTYRIYYGNPGDTLPSYQNQLLEGYDSSKVHPILDASMPLDNPAYALPAGFVSTNRSGRIVNLILLACFIAVSVILLRNISLAVNKSRKNASGNSQNPD